MSRLDRFKAWWGHAFAVESDAAEAIDAADRELVERLANFVVRRQMSGPALMVLESGRPLNFIGSQVLVFMAPFMTFIFSPPEYERFARLLEKRRSIDLLIDAIVARENEWTS
jgi:hypothetical protein